MKSLPLFVLFAAATVVSAQSAKPPISLDEFFSATSVSDSRLAPDGASAVIATDAPDWKNSIFRHDLWLWTAAGGLKPLTHSGSEESPRFSPDGKWIAFLSDRALPGESAKPDGEPESDDAKASRLWLIPPSGGEALPLYTEKLDVHAYAWAPDSSALYLAVQIPQTADEKDAQKEEWKDVIRWREQLRGDLVLKIALAPALERALATPLPEKSDSPDGKKDEAKKDKKPETLPAGSATLATFPLAITELEASPDGKTLALMTGPVHHRTENPSDYEIYTVPASGGPAHRLTNNQALESGLHWAADSASIYFLVRAAGGALDGHYQDQQGRIYRTDAVSGKITRLGSSFTGSFDSFTLVGSKLLATGQKGTEIPLYLVEGDTITPLAGAPGAYSDLDAAAGHLLLCHSAFNDPTQVYLAADPLRPAEAKPLTAFNPVFAQRAQPEGMPYTWTSDDGTKVEGYLIFPPGKKGAKHLRMLTLIHGGPADADGNHFGADWYDWASLAATQGWLVFRPNYRGSTAYGDQFMRDIAPHLVSKPGRDILTGVDALVKDGYADPDHLAIGGYSYGGYMTNWLITQTTRFRSAITGAGAIEHAANWGNDDLTFDDAWYLGGRPWENPALYQSEAALYQFNKVKTPTLLVHGGADVRVSYLEGVAIERALQSLNVPHTFLTFPGEGHGLAINPWHGYIKVREELKWLEKYDK